MLYYDVDTHTRVSGRRLATYPDAVPLYDIRPDYDEWSERLYNPPATKDEDKGVEFVDGEWRLVWNIVPAVHTPEEDEAHLNEAKAAKLKEVLAKSDETLNTLAYRYSENEKLSWPKQEVEARALETNPEAPAPLLRGIAGTRGIPVAELADKVLANVAQSEQATSYVLGTQQKYEDMIKAATTVDELSFDIDYTLPIV